jgi:replication factor C subunit 3/5
MNNSVILKNEAISIKKNNPIPWVEKYRPTKFDNIVLDPINQKLFENILSKNYFPNLLFYGPPGTGKTTTIINLINEFQAKYSTINKNLVIHLNASDERGIDIIRNQIFQFIKTNNMFDIGMKFVILDEVDYMTKNAQQALKYLLQTCNQNVRFCLICNYISKIDESLQNEFICIRFNQLPKLAIYQFIKTISENENLNINYDSIETIQNMFQSDIRSMINFIQLNQNTDLINWDKKVINRSVLENIHGIVIDPLIPVENIKLLIYRISIQYNIDKKSILLKYFHHLIRIFIRDIETTNMIHSHSNKKKDTSKKKKNVFIERESLQNSNVSFEIFKQLKICNDDTYLNFPVTNHHLYNIPKVGSDISFFFKFLSIIEVMLHNNDIKTETLLDFFVYKMREFWTNIH